MALPRRFLRYDNFALAFTRLVRSGNKEYAERRALGFLAGRFSFTAYATGETLLVESALAALAVEGISFTSEGPASYAETIPAFRTPPAHPGQ